MRNDEPLLMVGDPAVFAIESGMPHALPGPPEVNAIGWFCVHVGGAPFGIRQHNATWLAPIYEHALWRRQNRNAFRPGIFERDENAELIAEAYRASGYAKNPPRDSYFGMSLPMISRLFGATRIVWSEAYSPPFDDGSVVLHLDQENEGEPWMSPTVRLIAFRSRPAPELFDRGSLRDVRLGADRFYEILTRWCEGVRRQWEVAPKKNPDRPDW